MPYGKLSWRNRELRLFYDEKRKRTIANPVMLQIYGDSVQTVRQDNRLTCARGQLRSQSKKRLAENPRRYGIVEQNRLDACWDYPPVVGQGHLWVVTATSTTKVCFRQV